MENEKEFVKNENWYKEIIKNLRHEISLLIKENSRLKERIIDLEMIDKSHQELVGHLLEKNKRIENEKFKK